MTLRQNRGLSVLPSADKDAAEIGRLYQLSRTSLLHSMKYAVECGLALIGKKTSMQHGEWLPWLKENADALGMNIISTPQRLMKLAGNSALTQNLDESTAVAISRNLWGNKDSELVQQSLSNDHYTPKQYIDAARLVMGSIDLDPASCAEANRIVGAERFYTAEDDGLQKDWSGRVWLNPPYGRNVGAFVGKFVDEYGAGRIECGIILVNAHCTDTDWFQALWGGLLCFTDHRINFYGDDARSGSTHGSVFVYFGSEERKFGDTFSEFGTVVREFIA